MGYRVVKGDATCHVPLSKEAAIIVHVCNDIGAWGAGFVMALSRKWLEPEEQYRNWFVNGYTMKEWDEEKDPEFAKRWNAEREKTKFELGNVGYTQVGENLIVGNMIGQHGCGRRLVPLKEGYYKEHKRLNSLIEEVGEPKSSPYSPIDYVALYDCLTKVRDFALEKGYDVAMPMIGSKLAGGDWNFIEEMIKRVLKDVEVTVYQFD